MEKRWKEKNAQRELDKEEINVKEQDKLSIHGAWAFFIFTRQKIEKNS